MGFDADVHSAEGSGATANETKLLFNNPIDGPPIPESEDCLFMNVYTPRNASAKGVLKPVMFWLFGVSYSFYHSPLCGRRC